MGGTSSSIPRPWDEKIDEMVNTEDALPLCHHCLTPQEHEGWFCPVCGATFGPYVNYMPYVYIFSQGEMLRAGVTERFRHTRLIRWGFVLYSVFMYALFAPIYLYFLFRNLAREEAPPPQTETPSKP